MFFFFQIQGIWVEFELFLLNQLLRFFRIIHFTCSYHCENYLCSVHEQKPSNQIVLATSSYMTTTSHAPHYPALNGLRGMSIILVVLHHCRFQLEAIPWIGDFNRQFPLFTDGQFGVQVFFVISGFLITHLLLLEQQRYGQISIRGFYIRRTLRIFPAYYFLLLVYFVLSALQVFELSWNSWLTSLTYTKYLNWKLDYFTAHAWSLSIEEQFYLVWPLLFVWAARWRQAFLMAIVLICPLVRALNTLTPIECLNDLTLFQRLDAIALGCLLAIHRERLAGWLTSKRWIIWVVGVWLMAFSPFGIWSAKLEPTVRAFCAALLGSIGTITTAAIALGILYILHRPKVLLHQFFAQRWLQQIGILSYSIYLWQQLFTSDTAFGRNAFPLNILFIAVAALLSYYLVERPFLRLKNLLSEPKGSVK